MISSLSFCVIPGRLIGIFGTLTPFFVPSSPPLIIRQTISVSVVDSTLSSISPSSMRIVLPTLTSAGSPLYVICPILSSPVISLVVSVYVLPSTRVTFLPSARLPVRISGPLVSRSMAIGSPNSSLTLLTKSTLPFCSSWSPCEKLNLAISIPLIASCFNSSLSLVFGPIVQMIFVLFILNLLKFYRNLIGYHHILLLLIFEPVTCL